MHSPQRGICKLSRKCHRYDVVRLSDTSSLDGYCHSNAGLRESTKSTTISYRGICAS